MGFTPVDPGAVQRLRAMERDFGVGFDTLPWSSPKEASLALPAEGLLRLATFRARVSRAWLTPDPKFAFAEAFAAADPRSRVAVYPNAAPGRLRWHVNSIGGTLGTVPIKHQDIMPTVRQYALQGSDPFADTPVMNAALMRANVNGAADPTVYFERLLEPNDAAQQLRMVTYEHREASLYSGFYRNGRSPRFTLLDHALLLAMRPTFLFWSRLAKALGPHPLGEAALVDTLSALSQPALIARKERIIYTNLLGRACVPEARAWMRAGRPPGYGKSVPLSPGGFDVELVLPAAAPTAAERAVATPPRFELTPAEARVAEGLVRGGALRDLATELGMTYETARTHLKRIYSKVGVRRQAELVAKLLRG